jgi:hypothetical protein
MTWLSARSDEQRTCFTVLWSHYVGAVGATASATAAAAAAAGATGAAAAVVDSSRQLLFESLGAQLKGTDR